jgi:transposase
MKLKDARLLPPVIQQSIRHEALELFSKGFSKVHIAKLLCVSRKSVYKWVKAHSKSGSKGLQIHKRGRPKGTRLQPWQSAQIVNLIKNYCPDQF